MKTIENYIDELKEKTGSDYKIAQAMGCDKSVIANIRKRGAIAEENAVKVADLLGIDEEEVLLAAAIARSEGPVKAAWMKLSKRAGIAASVALMAIMTPKKAEAGYSPNLQEYNIMPSLCARAMNAKSKLRDASDIAKSPWKTAAVF